MMIITTIVLYNPQTNFFPNYEKYYDFSDFVIFLDNSTRPNNSMIQAIRANQKSIYFPFGENKGIAYALKMGMEKALALKADFVLTMDQDSIFPFSKWPLIKKVLQSEEARKFGIVALNFNQKESDELSVFPVRCWLTSGDFISAEKYQTLDHGFDDRFFIDQVDTNICYEFYKKGIPVGFIPGISITHTIGNPHKITLGLLSFNTLNYPPVRYYYMFRNAYFMYYHIDKRFFKKDHFSLKYKMRIRLLFEKNRRVKYKAMRLGIRDGKNGILGPCRHKEIL
jgi:rhamnosyltransferase